MGKNKTNFAFVKNSILKRFSIQSNG